MIVIIVGANRVEFCKVPSRKVQQCFFQTKSQMYKIYPHFFRRCRIVKNGIEKESEEVMVFPENGRIPYFYEGNATGVDPFDQDTILPEMDELKCRSKGLFGRKAWITSAQSVWKSIVPYAGIIVVGLVIVYAFGKSWLGL